LHPLTTTTRRGSPSRTTSLLPSCRPSVESWPGSTGTEGAHTSPFLLLPMFLTVSTLYSPSLLAPTCGRTVHSATISSLFFASSCPCPSSRPDEVPSGPRQHSSAPPTFCLPCPALLTSTPFWSTFSSMLSCERVPKKLETSRTPASQPPALPDFGPFKLVPSFRAAQGATMTRLSFLFLTTNCLPA
jgi:hypothetical protein